MKFNNYYFLALIVILTTTKPTHAQDLIEAKLLRTYVPLQLILQFGLPATNSIELYKIQYTTPNAIGVKDTASGLLVVPLLDEALPVVAYHHGTTSPRENVASREQFHIAELYLGGNGFITTSADFLGMGDAKGFHPYLHAATQASASIDLLRAVRTFCENKGIQQSEHLFITGYSQGGHAAMATFRALETSFAAEFTVTAAAPLSGPYNLTGSFRADITTNREYLFPAYFAYLVKGYQAVYGNIYTELTDIFRPQYAALINKFDNQPDYALDALNEDLLKALREESEVATPRFLFQNNIITAFTENDTSNPLINALNENNVFDWIPNAPMRMYYCEADEQVPFQNATFTDSLMNARGAKDVQAISVGENLNHGACSVPAFLSAETFFRTFLETTSTKTPWAAKDVDIIIYPNPTSDVLNIQIDNPSEEITLTLFDELGRIVQMTKNETSIHIAHMKNGYYLLKIQTKEQVIVKRVIKQAEQ